MTLHGGGPARFRADAKPHAAFRTVVAEGLPPGFRHYALKGRYRPAVTRNRQAMAERCARLAARMAASVEWEAVPLRQDGIDDPIQKQNPDISDNPYIPSGYTYLLQFVAHDMVATRVPFWATTNLDQDTANDRSHRLRLDALYGDGPATLRTIYAPGNADDLSRIKLQIGRSGPVQTRNGGAVCPFRDVARLKLSNTLNDLPGLTEPLIADPRNDDHALISQLTMVFSHLHNIFIDRQGAEPVDASTRFFTSDAAKRFANAREATTLVYRHVVRHDLLRRLLHPAVYKLYAAGAPPFLDMLAGARTAGVPLEFSHAALRFAHAMVKDSYRINDASPAAGQSLDDRQNRHASGGNMGMEPMSASWVVQWSNFFNFKGATDPDSINLSRRIGPATPRSLAASAVGPIDPSNGAGIFYRDLISGELANLWPVPELLTAMREHKSLAPIVHGSPLLQHEQWQTEIAHWLRAGLGPEADQIAADPPLLFFVLFEAFKDPESRGCRLGRFGSILLADTLFGELNNRLPSEQRGGSLADQLRSVHPGFDDPAFDRPASMPAVIGFIERCLQKSDDPAMRFPSLL